MPKYYETLPIKDMEPGMDVEGFFLLGPANVKTTNSGSPFLSFKVSDKTGEVDAKMWDYHSDIHEHPGAVVKIRGSVGSYNGAKQIVAERMRLAEPSDGYNLSELVPCAPINVDSTYSRLVDVLNTIQDDTYRAIALRALVRYGEAFKTIPAGRSMHHAFLNGLLMHTYNVVMLALAVGEIYGQLIDIDLLVTGAFCHDMGKRKEFVVSEIGLVSEYSIPGNLLGHLVMGAQEIVDIARELNLDENSEKVLLLQHMLLSHHGEPEFGAAVPPKCLEAEILSRLDMLDAKVEMYRETAEKTEPGKMSDFARGFNRAVYIH